MFLGESCLGNFQNLSLHKLHNVCSFWSFSCSRMYILLWFKELFEVVLYTILECMFYDVKGYWTYTILVEGGYSFLNKTT